MVTVLGWYGHGNTGDEAYRLAFPALFPGLNFEFTDRITAEPEAVVLGGGNVLSPHFLDQVVDFRSPVHLLSVGLTPKDKVYLENTGKVLARDLASVEHLTRQRARYCPDFTFALNPDPVRGRQLVKDLFLGAGLEWKGRAVGVVLNAYPVVRDGLLARDLATFEKLCVDLAGIIDAVDVNFLLLPFGNGFPHNDRVPNSWLYSKAKWWKRVLPVYQHLGVQDTLDAVAGCEALFSSRLHSSIFAALAGVPFIDITHHDKNLHFLRSLEREEWSVPWWHFDSVRARDLLNKFLGHRRHADDLKAAADRMKKTLREETQGLRLLD